jgi:hypothetical protein
MIAIISLRISQQTQVVMYSMGMMRRMVMVSPARNAPAIHVGEGV